MDAEIKRMQENDTDFFEQVAGAALATLRKMYGDSLSQVDVRRVVEHLTGFAKEHLKENAC
jgi:hypothetical protein